MLTMSMSMSMSIPLSPLLMSPTSACTTTAGLAAVTAATAAAAVGIAYWSSSTNTSSVGTILLEFLRAAGCDIKEDNEEDDDDDDSIISDIKMNKDCNTNTMNDKEAFLLSLLDEKDDEYDNCFYAHDDEDLTNIRWISETIRDAILSTTATTITKKKKKKKKKKNIKLLNDEDEDKTKTEIKEESKEEFYRSFRILQKAIKETNIQEPNIREDYFNGVGTIMDDEKEVEQLLTYLRFVELAKDEIYDAYCSSSSVEFDHEHNGMTNNIFTTNNSKHTIISPLQKHRREQRRRRLKRMMVPDSNGYELHRCVATPIIIDDDGNTINKSTSDDNDDDDDDDDDERCNAVVVGHLVAIHCGRKEIIIAVHYDDTSFVRCRMKNTLTDEIFLQHQQEQDHRTTNYNQDDDDDDDDDATASTASTTCSTTNNGSDDNNKSNSSYNSTTPILDQATDYLQEEILHYLRSTKVILTGYTLTVCGHSIGAALACRLGIALKNDNNRDTSFNGNESKSESESESESMTEQLTLRVYAFGLPPVRPPTSSSRQRSHYCDESGGGDDDDDDDDDEHHSGDNNKLNKNNEEYSFITSVINNHDCRPRWTQSNLTVLQKQLRWTMDQKKLHVRQYYNHNNSNHFYDQQSYRCSGQQQQTTTTSTTATSRHQSLPPPFAFSFREWKKFWKNCKREEEEEKQTEEMNQERNDRIHGINNDGNNPQNYKNINNVEYIVPGKIVCIWNNTQDSTIIGTNVYHHRPMMRTNVNNNNHRHNNYNNVLGRIWIDESMFYDNTLEAYRSNLELLLGQAANTI
jgi:hypothetical protein